MSSSDLAPLSLDLDLERYRPRFRPPEPYRPGSDADLRAALRRLPATLTPFHVPLATLVARLSKTLQGWALAQRWPIPTTVITGPTEAGKTTAVAVAIRRMLAHQARGRGARPGGDPYQDDEHRATLLRFQWFSALELATASARHPMGRGEAEEPRLARHAPLLVIDDLGKEETRSTQWLIEAIEHREHRLTTIITTERSMTELNDRYGAGNFRRLTKGALVLDVNEVTR
jgi:hypothetical protein